MRCSWHVPLRGDPGVDPARQSGQGEGSLGLPAWAVAHVSASYDDGAEKEKSKLCAN